MRWRPTSPGVHDAPAPRRRPVPCTGWTELGDAGQSVRWPIPTRRARRQIQGRRRRLRHRHPLLQGHRQHRHTRRHLWTAPGQLLATATFTDETASRLAAGRLRRPGGVTANTVYVASYFAPNGNYAGDNVYFASTGVDNGPVHLLCERASGGNGVYALRPDERASRRRPIRRPTTGSTWCSPTAGGRRRHDAADGHRRHRRRRARPASRRTRPSRATFSEAMNAATRECDARSSCAIAANALVTATVTYDATTRTATLTPSARAGRRRRRTPRRARRRHRSARQGRGRQRAGGELSPGRFTTAAGTGGLRRAANPIVAENCLTGNPRQRVGHQRRRRPSIQGFATDISVNRGSTVGFKVRHDRRRTTASTSIAGLLRRHGRAQGRDGHAVGDVAADQPTV